MNIITTSGVSSITFHSAGALRAFSPTAGPFHLGLLAACVLVIGFVFHRSNSRPWPWLALASLAAFVLGATLTRANMIAGLCALAVLVIGSQSLRGRVRSVAPAVLLVGFVLVAAVFTVAVSTVGSSSSTTHPATSGSTSAVTAGVSGQLSSKNLVLRVGYWADFAKAIEAQPLIGYGTSSAGDGFRHYYSGTGHSYFDPHSLYLKPALELGLAGLAIFLAILAMALRLGLRALRTDRAIGLIWLGVLTAVAVSGITGPMLDAYPVNLFFWSMFGWAALVAAPWPTSSPVPTTDDAGAA
jgi:O-antigen ligase